jgi:hypothetical protein
MEYYRRSPGGLACSPIAQQKKAMQVTIRRALMSDAQELSMVSRETFYDTFTGTCTPEDMEAFLDAHFNLEQVKGELSNKEDFFLPGRDA